MATEQELINWMLTIRLPTSQMSRGLNKGVIKEVGVSAKLRSMFAQLGEEDMEDEDYAVDDIPNEDSLAVDIRNTSDMIRDAFMTFQEEDKMAESRRSDTIRDLKYRLSSYISSHYRFSSKSHGVSNIFFYTGIVGRWQDERHTTKCSDKGMIQCLFLPALSEGEEIPQALSQNAVDSVLWHTEDTPIDDDTIIGMLEMFYEVPELKFVHMPVIDNEGEEVEDDMLGEGNLGLFEDALPEVDEEEYAKHMENLRKQGFLDIQPARPAGPLVTDIEEDIEEPERGPQPQTKGSRKAMLSSSKKFKEKAKTMVKKVLTPWKKKETVAVKEDSRPSGFKKLWKKAKGIFKRD